MHLNFIKLVLIKTILMGIINVVFVMVRENEFKNI